MKNDARNFFMALDGEESTPVPNLALEAIVKPALREVMIAITNNYLLESSFAFFQRNNPYRPLISIIDEQSMLGFFVIIDFIDY